MWVRSSGPSLVSGILTGAMLGALSMFSTEVTGQSLKSIEMSGGFRLHVRPFHQGEINLAIIGDQKIMSDPELLSVIQRLDEDISVMVASSAIDPTDPNMVQIYLDESINLIDKWFETKVFVEGALQKARSEHVVEISSKITLMSAKITQEKIGVLILDASLEALYSEPTDTITESFFASFQDHFRGWVHVSVHQDQLIPTIMFFKNLCLGIGIKKNIYIVCAIEWKGSIGDPKVISKIRSWISLLSRRLG